MSRTDRVRAMVVDDHPVVRNGLRDVLEASGPHRGGGTGQALPQIEKPVSATYYIEHEDLEKYCSQMAQRCYKRTSTVETELLPLHQQPGTHEYKFAECNAAINRLLEEVSPKE